MRRLLVIAFVINLIFGALLGLPLLIGIWLPDVISAPRHILAERRLADGHVFRVVQYWNRSDFYNTELVHLSPNGTIETHLLDADDSKSWHVPLLIDEQHKIARITLNGGRVKSINW
jgi:hypothetical protein